jgi:hypothetical protein
MATPSAIARTLDAGPNDLSRWADQASSARSTSAGGVQ